MVHNSVQSVAYTCNISRLLWELLIYLIYLCVWYVCRDEWDRRVDAHSSLYWVSLRMVHSERACIGLLVDSKSCVTVSSSSVSADSIECSTHSWFQTAADVGYCCSKNECMEHVLILCTIFSMYFI